VKSKLSPEIIEQVPIGQLVPYPNNARTHSKEQIQQIANSILAFGFTNSLLKNLFD
jgi:ParB-like chromosome segregation protein Spo0J